MDKKTRILIPEDNDADAELAVRELRRAGTDFEFRRVDSLEQFCQSLNDFDPDLILSDYTLPSFTGLEALEILKGNEKSLPFLLCTGSLTEEVAVDCMRAGADDYILKSSLKRLPSAVLNALKSHHARLEKETAVEALRKSETEFRAIVETTNEWIWAVDQDGTITYSNPAIESILGYLPSEVQGRRVYDLLDQEERRHAVTSFETSVRTLKGWSELVNKFRSKDGNVRFLESNGVPAFDANSRLIGFRGSTRDITERKQAEEKVLHDAFHDPLTSLPNRALFMMHLEMRCVTESNRFGVIFIDLDRLKVVNDSLGYSDGDAILQLFAERLTESIRPGDLVARFGGDEFTLLLHDLDSEADASRIVDRINEKLRTPFEINGRQVFMTVSCGIAIGGPELCSAEDLIRGADMAMYRAKSRGNSQFQIFDALMLQPAVTQLQLENEIRQGLERGEFRVFYQPIIGLASDSLFGFEALVRWQHPDRGLMSPVDFIPAAEVSGLILPLGNWVLEESCRQVVEWQHEGLIGPDQVISVNLSAKQFINPGLAQQISEVLSKTGLSPKSLKLEITETHVMENGEVALSAMNEIRSLGASISLDDFGTGYSSLSYLHSLPFDFLKIDRSFVMRMIEHRKHQEIISTIIKLAKNLKIKTIAEGIETEAQLEQLRQLDCDFGQGFFFERPISALAAREYVLSLSNTSNLQSGLYQRFEQKDLREM